MLRTHRSRGVGVSKHLNLQRRHVTTKKPNTTKAPKSTPPFPETKLPELSQSVITPTASQTQMGSYFTQYSRLQSPTQQLDSVGVNTTGIDYQPQDQHMSKSFSKQIKLGKHRAKISIENAPTISKSLYMSLQSGSLPTLIQKTAEFENMTGQTHQPDSLSLESEVYDDDFLSAHNALISQDLSDLNIKTNLSKEKKKDTPSKPPTTAKYGGNDKQTRFGNSGVPIEETDAIRLGPTPLDISAAATAANWFPGHMKKALDDMAEKIKHVPMTIEVRDARLPLSSANPLLDSLTANKIKVIVLNKTDLVKDSVSSLTTLAKVMDLPVSKLRMDKTLHPIVMKSKPKPGQNQSIVDKQEAATLHSSEVDTWLNTLLTQYPDMHSLPSAIIPSPHIISENRKLAIILTNNNSLETTKSLLSLIKALSPKKKFGSLPTSAILCGFPNVGKSTLINNLKTSARMTLGKDGLEQGRWSLGTVQNMVSKARAKIGPLPGVTRQVQGFKVSQSPSIVILDSPGIMVPRFDRTATGIQTSYKLALVQCISDTIADPRSQCELMLSILNQFPEKMYTRYYNIPLQAPIHDLTTLFPFIVKKEEIQPQSITQWREGVQKSRFGRILSQSEYQNVLLRSRKREKDVNINLGALLNDYEKKKNTTVDIKDFSSNYQFPSKEEIHYEISPEMEDLCLRAMLRAFRTGKLGKFLLD